MTESVRPEIKAVEQAEALHAIATRLVDKAEGKIPLDPGESISFLDLYTQAAGLEQIAFTTYPKISMERRSALAALGVSYMLESRDAFGAMRFGFLALEELGPEISESAEKKIRDEIIKASEQVPKVPISQ